MVMQFIEEAVFNSFILYYKVNPGKLNLMQFKLAIVEKTIESGQPIYRKFTVYPKSVVILRVSERKRKKRKYERSQDISTRTV